MVQRFALIWSILSVKVLEDKIVIITYKGEQEVWVYLCYFFIFLLPEGEVTFDTKFVNFMFFFDVSSHSVLLQKVVVYVCEQKLTFCHRFETAALISKIGSCWVETHIFFYN